MEVSKLEYIVRAIGRAEDYFFSYCANRNRNMTYVFKTCIIFFFGTLIPGYVFMVIEGSNEVPIYPYNLTPDRIELIREFYKIKTDQITEDEFHIQAGALVEEYREKVIIYTEVKEFIHDHGGFHLWTLWNSIGYAATVYTTLGYGELTPNTYVGRTLTIIYALVGIPLFLIALSDFGRFITVFVKILWSYVRRLYYTGSFRKHNKKLDLGALSQIENDKDSNVMGQDSEETPTTFDISTFDVDDEFVLPVSLIILLFAIYTVMASLVYARWEGWTFFESYYFVFISLSTVGFGDFIPRKRFCMILSIFVIFIGLAICTMLVDAIMESVEARFRPEDEHDGGNEYDMSDESGSSLEPSDILDHAYDESIMKIINQEDQEEAKLGIRRSKSRSLHALSRLMLLKDDSIIDAANVIEKQTPLEEIELHQIDYFAETTNNTKEETNIEVEKIPTKEEGPIHNKKVKEKQGKIEYLKNLALKQFKLRK